MSDKPYVGQVIVEKGFATKAAAENWAARVSAGSVAASADNVETHIWEPATGGYGRKVKP